MRDNKSLAWLAEIERYQFAQQKNDVHTLRERERSRCRDKRIKRADRVHNARGSLCIDNNIYIYIENGETLKYNAYRDESLAVCDVCTYLSNDCAPRSPRERGRPEIASRRGNRDSVAGSPRSSSQSAVVAA